MRFLKARPAIGFRLLCGTACRLRFVRRPARGLGGRLCLRDGRRAFLECRIRTHLREQLSALLLQRFDPFRQ